MQALRRHKWVFVIIVLLLAGIMVGRSLYQSKYSLNCTLYQISSDKIDTPVRIVQLTDLHNSEFGENNQELIDRVTAQFPDLILITGDLLNADETRTDIATNLIFALCDIAPVYISLGNHEIEYHENFGKDIVELYQNLGAEVLEWKYKDITINGQHLRLGGIYGYCLSDKYLKTEEADPEECAFMTDFQDTDLFTVLMCHIPVCWMINDGLDEWDVDCVFSGHVHGGQAILPLIGGVFAPDMSWFPGRLEGIFSSEMGNKALVLSRGLGNTENIPRFNNIPEIVVVDLVPQSF